MANIRINEARLRRIQSRQLQDAWGKNYRAAIQATPAEAPGISTPCILHPGKLGGRPLHTLSRPETWAALLALYHPNVWDIHEQRMLYPGPRPHFLHGHPKALGKVFKPLQGTIAVAEEMGCLSRHPRCRVYVDGKSRMAPYPYLGDLLLCIEDVDGPYLVNWTIKDKFEDFHRRGPRPGKLRQSERDQSAEQRHALEARYYMDAGIPTRQVAGRQINHILACNLRRLFLFQNDDVVLPQDVCQAMHAHFQSYVGSNKPAYKLIKDLAGHLDVNPDVVHTVLAKGIWQRQVQVDLFQPIFFDRVLRPQSVDPILAYSAWFAREEV